MAKRSKGEYQVWSPQCKEQFLPIQVNAGRPLREHGVVQAGRCDLNPGYKLRRTASIYHLVIYTVAGCGRLVADGDSAFIRPGVIMLAPVRRAYAYEPVRRHWRFYWFHLDDTEQWEHLCQWRTCAQSTGMAGSMGRAIEGYLKESLCRRPASLRAALLYAELITLYLDLELKSSKDPRTRTIEENLYALWDRVSRDLGRRWSVENLAAELDMSGSHFHRVVLAHTGATPMQMVTRLRMEKAREMLASYALSVRTVAEAVGYDNEFAFSTAFKRHAGICPREFRKRS